MLYVITFYVFALFLTYTDCTKYLIPNNILISLLISLIVFGLFEGMINPYSLIVVLGMLLFFVIILIALPNMILGGGDIKYMLVIALYLSPLVFPLFLLCSGIYQLIFLLYRQKVKKRRVAPMAPMMGLGVATAEILDRMGYNPIYH